MAFGNITQQLAIPAESTAVYTFFQFQLCAAGPPSLTMRHVGDGTPAYKTATWHATNLARARRQGADKTISERRIKQLMIEDAKLIADYCVASWDNVVEDGATQPTPCTPDKVLEFLTTIIESAEGISTYRAFKDWASDADNFRSITVESGDLGKV